jgi:RNA polymerase sigma-70 factor (ECF subfamily)
VVQRRIGASDIVQEAWLAAFTSLDAFQDRGPGSFGRWLLQIVRHKARDQVRRHLGARKRGARQEEELRASQARRASHGEGETPSAVAMRHEERAGLREALGRLPEAQRWLLERVHRDGMTLAEVGELTGRSANAVCKAYGRALQALGRLMERRKDA